MKKRPALRLAFFFRRRKLVNLVGRQCSCRPTVCAAPVEQPLFTTAGLPEAQPERHGANRAADLALAVIRFRDRLAAYAADQGGRCCFLVFQEVGKLADRKNVERQRIAGLGKTGEKRLIGAAFQPEPQSELFPVDAEAGFPVFFFRDD